MDCRAIASIACCYKATVYGEGRMSFVNNVESCHKTVLAISWKYGYILYARFAFRGRVQVLVFKNGLADQSHESPCRKARCRFQSACRLLAAMRSARPLTAVSGYITSPRHLRKIITRVLPGRGRKCSCLHLSNEEG